MNDKDTALIWEAYASKDEERDLVWESYVEAQKTAPVVDLVWESVYQTADDGELAWDKDNRDLRNTKYTAGQYEIVGWQNGDGSYSVEVKAGGESLLRKDNLEKKEAGMLISQMKSTNNTTELDSAMGQARGYVEPEGYTPPENETPGRAGYEVPR